MHTSLLQAFVTVAREGNLTRAAHKLYISQPALSQKIRKLQEALDLELFERTAHGMRLTEAGRHLLPTAERVLNVSAEFDAAASGLSGTVTGRLRIGTILDPEFLRLGGFLKRLVERNPRLAIELRHGMSLSVSREVDAGTLDVCFTLGEPELREFRDRFHVVALTAFSYRVVAPAGWGARVRGRGWRELAALPWIGTPHESVHSRLLARVFEDQGITPNLVAHVDLEPSMLDLVRSGVGLSLARDSIALAASHKDGLAVADRVSLQAELGFICRRDRNGEAPIAAALAAIAGLWGQFAEPGGSV